MKATKYPNYYREHKINNYNIIYLLLDKGSKNIPLRKFRDRIIKDNNLSSTLAVKLKIQKYLASNDVYNEILPLIDSCNLNDLIASLYANKELKNKLSTGYLLWVSKELKND